MSRPWVWRQVLNSGLPAAPASRNNMCAMARSHLTRHRPGPVPARRPAGRLARPVRACMATGAVALSAVLPLLASPADAQPTAQAQPVSAPLTLTVTSMSPSYAEQGHTITIAGRVRNLSGSALSGLSVRLLASRAALGSRFDLESFASGSLPQGGTQVNTAPVTLQRLGAGQRWRWSMRVPASALGLSCFGVYPLTVVVSDAALETASDPVPLPYWPTKPGSCSSLSRPHPFAISWIWPLIDSPHQGACAGLIDNRLATSIAPDGRLGYLLAIGAQYAARARLTWAIDSALLESVRAMQAPYQVGTSARCGIEPQHPASPDAGRWLAGLRRATSGQPVFVTPYADVDVAALTAHTNNTDLDAAFADAEQTAHQILGRSPVPARLPAGSRQLSAIAWPVGGIASSAVLESLAVLKFNTVILAAPAFSPVSYTPGAVTRKLTGPGYWVHILLADHAITALLGSKDATSPDPGEIFRVRELYLAETAMIAAEWPGKPRPIVVAPPRRWDPPRGLAAGLLSDTVHAPWLHPSAPGQLVAMRPEHIYKNLTQSNSKGEISGRLLRKVARLDRRIALLQSIRVGPDPALNRAVFAIESAAWRGKAAKHAQTMLARTSRYVESQLRGLSIRGGGKHAAFYVTFGGKVSTVKVAIRNNLRYPVRVGLLVSASKANVSGEPISITIPKLSYSTPVKLTVHVKANQGRIRLSLVSPTGTPLAGHPLPAYPLVIFVHPTDFGTVALVICAIALAVFVIASAFRAIRHGRPVPASDAAAAEPAEPPAAGAEPSAATGTEPSAAGPEPSGIAVEQSAAAEPPRPAASGWPGSPSGRIAPPDPQQALGDDTGMPHRAFVDLGSRPELTDSVEPEPSGLTSAGPVVADQKPAAPGRRATEERR